MNVFLLYKDHDFDLKRPLRWNEKALTQDLELDMLFSAMADKDDFLMEVVKKVVLSAINCDPETILYRQEVLKDCLNNVSILSQIYTIAVSAKESWQNNWFSVFTSRPSSVLSSSIGMMHVYLSILKQLRNVADQYAVRFKSDGFTRFFDMIKKELTDEYFLEIEKQLKTLRFPYGILISARLDEGNKGTGYTLHKPQVKKPNWWQRLFPRRPSGYYFSVHPRDEAGVRYLSDIRDKGLNLVANALAQSNDHILGFFNTLRVEIAFYIGCIHLQEKLTLLGEPCTFPHITGIEKPGHAFTDLYDVCLALSMKKKIVGNDLQAEDAGLILITGANQGGKSTFLRSIGVAQLMMQSGMFVPATSFSTSICSNLFTHFKREEDSMMKSGKFDEELSRMSEITDHITPDSLFLFNESFAATNEREGSEIARQIVNALLDNHQKIFFVTHLYAFAHDFYEEKRKDVVFLRAERQPDTSRTYKLVEGEPLPTSYGIDLYKKMFEK